MKPLSETNPYLRDKSRSTKLVTVSVTSSTAIELGTVSPVIIKAIAEKIPPGLFFTRLTRN